MDEKRYRLPGGAALSIAAGDADTLLALRDGEAALLYLYILRAGGELRLARAAEVLQRTEEQLLSAAETLRRAGLLSTAGDVLPGAEELPEYSAEDILRRSRTDSAFQALVAEAQRVLGHALSGADLKTLFGIYDRLGMPGDVVMLLINHCADVLRRRYGEGRLPTMHAVSKEAFRWANREILTLEQAEAYIADAQRREAEEEKVRRALGICVHDTATTERKYMDSWLSMGYGSEALALAYDRTVVGTGRLAWAYMDKIVRSWYEKGLFTVEEIEKGDGRPQGRKRPAKNGAAPAGEDDSDRLAALLNIGKE